ncbi:EamA family transporter [Paenibacillus sp. SAFN-117]|uniref:EamA family transporter n=1 Tax=Paenibacillus sp. SAFN-117 TaxID=3436860 RepID=UPI003F7D34AF
MMRYVILVFLGACSFGVLSTFVKLAYQSGFTVNQVVGSQTLLGMLTLWIIFIVVKIRKKGGAVSPASFKEILMLMAVGTTTGLTGVFYYAALQYVPASLAIILLFQFSWMGLLIESLLNRRWPGKEKLVALLILLAGTVLASGILEQGLGSFTLAGVALGLVAALMYTLFILFSGRTAPHIHPAKRSAIMLTGSFILISIIFPPSFLVDGSLWNGLIKFAVVLALLGAVIPPFLFALGVPHIGGSLATILSAAELPTAVLASSLVLREEVSVTKWIGVLIILAGIALPEWIASLRRKRQLKLQ